MSFDVTIHSNQGSWSGSFDQGVGQVSHLHPAGRLRIRQAEQAELGDLPHDLLGKRLVQIAFGHARSHGLPGEFPDRIEQQGLFFGQRSSRIFGHGFTLFGLSLRL